MGEEDMAVAPVGNGCCGDSAWRGYLCQYHEGFRAGQDSLENMIADLRQTIRQLTDMDGGT
jgi:hypothetical protein